MRAHRVAILAVLVTLGLPAGASAATFCVHVPPGCVGTDRANLQAALDDAAANGAGRDTIRIGVGLFPDGPAVNVAGSPVDIIGTGESQTAIRTSSNQSGVVILDIQEATSTISDLRVHHTSSAPIATGIALAGDADGVLVTNGTLVTRFDGIRMVGTQASLDESTVNLIYPPNFQNRAVLVTSGADVDIDDSSLTGTVGVEASGGDLTIDRTRVHATLGVSASFGSTTAIRDSEIRVPGPSDSNFQTAALILGGDGSTTLDVDRVTASSEDGSGFGIWAQPNAGANSATVTLHGSILHNFGSARFLFEDAGASVTMTSDWSAYDLASQFVMGSPSYTAGPHMTDLVPLDPGFRDAATGDLRLRYDSPLIDAGDPAFQPFLGGIDLGSHTRVRDGDGSGSPSVVDLGAREYQHRPPVAAATASVAGASPGAAISFDASASSDPDDEELTFSWSFDDGTTASGETVQHAFAAAGQHTATVQVTDVTGLSDTATVTVAVSEQPPAITAPPADSGQAGVAPRLTQLRVQPSRFRSRGGKATRGRPKRPSLGTTIRYRLSEAAQVTFTIERALKGRRVGGACRKPRRTNRKARPCTRWVASGTLSRSGTAGANATGFSGRMNGKPLAPGHYRLFARAQAANGLRSAARGPKRFRVVS